MTKWIFDEDISRPAVKKFSRAGIKGKHIKDDLRKGGILDKEVLEIAKQERKTLITANTYDYLEMPDVDYLNTYGAWILNTEDPDEQVKLVKMALKVTGLDTLNKRKEKRLHIKRGEVSILDCRSRLKRNYKLPR